MRKSIYAVLESDQRAAWDAQRTRGFIFARSGEHALLVLRFAICNFNVNNPSRLNHFSPFAIAGISRPMWLVCLGLPLSVVIIELLGSAFLSPAHQRLWIASELGVTENATVIVALAAAVVGVQIFRARDGFPVSAWGWCGLFASAAAVYFAGEEASWGQHWFGWGSPEFFVDLNKQAETNLHNVNPLFGRIPKAIIEILMVVTGLYYAIALAKNPPPFGSRRYWLLPTFTVFPTCVLAVVCRLLNRYERWADVDLAIRWGEIQEYHIACFMLLYLLAIWHRLDRVSARL